VTIPELRRLPERPVPVRARAEVIANDAAGAGNWRLQLAVPEWPGSEPGQFVMLSPGAVGAVARHDPLLPRPMAVFRFDAGVLEVLYQVTGRGTALLCEARRGEHIDLVGPLGRPFPLPEPGVPALLVGGGTGVASLFGLAERAAAAGPLTILLGARSVDALMAREDFAALPGALRIATDDGSAGHRGLVTELLEEVLAAEGEAVVYACGPTAMMRRAAELAAGAGARCLVSLENRMACGYGVCLGCAVPGSPGPGFSLVCRDGPVFEASALAWEGVP